MSSPEPRGQELISRYKRNYAIPVDAPVTEEMILGHWELEKRLTRELLASAPKERWEIFDRCYSELYSTLDWLNQWTQTSDDAQTAWRHQVWRRFIGQPPQRIYEVGSGKAKLISWLASEGFQCRATEITRERGQSHTEGNPNLTWAQSDGIHLDQFESPESFDVVISDNVIEHLHPDDVPEHFRSIRKLLAPGGRYIFCTPHQCLGPCDVSAVFGRSRPEGMHLREYTFNELHRICRQAGFRKIGAALVLPVRFAWFGRLLAPRNSRLYLHYLQGLERFLLLLPQNQIRRKVAGFLKVALFPSSIFMTAGRE